MKNILCVVPSFTWKVHEKVQEALKNLIVPEWFEMDCVVIERKIIHVARNEAIKMTLQWKYDYLLFCDDDNAPLNNDALKLLIEADKDVISWIIRKRNSTWLAIFDAKYDERGFREYVSFEQIPETENDVFEVANCWTGFVLYKREVLEKVYVKYDCCPFENKLCHYIPTVTNERVELERFIWSPLIKLDDDGKIQIIKIMNSEDILFHERIRLWWRQIFAHKKVILDHYWTNGEIYKV